MKIVASPPLTPARPTSGRTAIGNGPSFNAMLNGAEAIAQAGDQRAFGFSELGMFGSGGATKAEAPQPSNRRPDAPKPSASEAALAATPGEPRADVRSAQARPAPVASETPRLVGLLQRPAGRQASAAAAETGTTPETLRPVDDNTAERPTSAERPSLLGAQRRLQASLEARGAMKVLVSGEGDDLKVVVAAVDDDPEAGAELRRVAAEVAHGLGMTLTGFVLNGAEIDNQQPR